ncbi:hypothetical protein ABIA33_001592 [Streptacidiphilus sp. MAP12-16]|uniref:hypothetical protein n=1 Tax=Streptacidiphilus sp. MAP12-16 TaxID=3156300 RepID=UPI003512021D
MTPHPTPAPAPAPEAAQLWAVPSRSRDLEWSVRLLGCAIAVLVTDPTAWLSRPPIDLLLPLLAVVGAWFAAPPLTARPVASGFRWYTRLARHRNTAFAVGCVLLAAANRPPGWLAACDTALLLTYLLCVDAVAAGPPGARLVRRPLALLTAYGASALVLTAALLPVAATGTWARLLAALALGASGAAVAGAVWVRRDRT